MTQELQQKLAELREKYSSSMESQIWIDDAETELRNLFAEKKMAEDPIFKRIADDAQNRLNEINSLLLNDTKLTDSAREALFKARDIWHFVFSRFGLQPHDEAIKLLTVTLDQKIGQ